VSDRSRQTRYVAHRAYDGRAHRPAGGPSRRLQAETTTSYIGPFGATRIFPLRSPRCACVNAALISSIG